MIKTLGSKGFWGEIGTLLDWLGIFNYAVTLENSVAVLQNVKHEVMIPSSNSPPEYTAKINENQGHTKMCTQMFIAAIL